MISRERLLISLNHAEPDRIPIDFGGPMSTVEVEGYRPLKRFLGVQGPVTVFTRAHSRPEDAVLQRFSVDTRYIYSGVPEQWNPEKYPDRSYDDVWGVTFKMPEGSYYYDPVAFPLREATTADLNDYAWPSSFDPDTVNWWKKQATQLSSERKYSIVADVIGWGIFEQAWALRGLSTFLIDIYKNRAFAEALLDKVLETQLRRFEAYLGAIGENVDVVVTSDDLGMQKAPIMSPDLYREVIKPRHRELYKAIRELTDAKIFLHTCGAVKPFIPDFIDLGIDILNPVQVAATGMGDTASLKKEFGKEMVFWGGACDSQKVLPFGTPAEVRDEVRRRIDDLAPGGGFVFAPIHDIQPGVPPENIVALYEAAIEFGAYGQP